MYAMHRGNELMDKIAGGLLSTGLLPLTTASSGSGQVQRGWSICIQAAQLHQAAELGPTDWAAIKGLFCTVNDE